MCAQEERFNMKNICSSTCYVLLAIIVLADMANAGLFEKGVAACDKDESSVAYNIFNKLAEQGHSESQNNLGLMYEFGKGVLQDSIHAHIWYNVLAENGYPIAIKIKVELHLK